MTNRSTSADFVTAFATGWPEQQPDIMVLSLTTHKGVQDFAFNREQALLIAKTIKKPPRPTSTRPKTRASRAKHARGIRGARDGEPGYFDSEILAALNWLSALM